ncbi:hypothetical protein [Cyclobacterium xiamenense]|uniref:hypothetical protein n=1 Tax=Cyclobacterium xiamenense TaxID=1297121 RepID=UPI0012B96C10|nr:hypothetical protein [Cyclobacterium xiamenense]
MEINTATKILPGWQFCCAVNTWEEIWATDLERAYGVDLEAYGPGSSDWNDALVDIYLSTPQ